MSGGKGFPSSATLLTATVFAGLATIACLMPVHNDTWWHLRAGHDMLRDRTLMFVDRFSYTTNSGFFWNHSWLAQLAFYVLFAAGGLPLLTSVCAILVIAAWALVYRLTRGPADMRILLLVLAVSSSTTIWSVRPQVFSIVLLPVVASLVSRDRWLPAVAVMLLWANLHAGMAIGVIVAAAAMIAAVAAERDRIARRGVGLLAMFAATLITPLGARNWTEMVASMARSRANHIQEWQMTPLPPEDLFFWGMAAVFVWQAVRRWKRLDSHEDRVLVVAGLLALPLAIRTLRNVPAFMMLATAAFTRLTWRRDGQESEGRSSPRLASLAAGALVVVCLAGLVVVWRAWSTPWRILGWRPMSQGAARAIAECPGPLYNTYDGGGPIIWFVPTQPVLLDSRQDPFPVPLVRAASQVEDTGHYESLFATWRVNCAALPPSSLTAARLTKDGWRTSFRDEAWVVLARPIPLPRAATSSPAP